MIYPVQKRFVFGQKAFGNLDLSHPGENKIIDPGPFHICPSQMQVHGE